jgi:uncharacterized membrane protein YiaA
LENKTEIISGAFPWSKLQSNKKKKVTEVKKYQQNKIDFSFIIGIILLIIGLILKYFGII